MESHSSSDCEETEHDLPHSQELSHNKKHVEELSLKCCLEKTGANESEICNILSQELQNKCKITEMDVDEEPQRTFLKNNHEVSKTSKEGKQVNSLLTLRSTKADGKKSLFINKCSDSQNSHKLPVKKQNKVKKSVNCITRGNSVKVMFPPSKCENKNTDVVLLGSKDSSFSEGGATYLPKSSLASDCRIIAMDDQASSSDDSSSISSSVRGSDSSSSIGSPKRAKRRLVLSGDKVSNKVPKMTESKSSQTTFTLREPKLNFTPPLETPESLMNNRISSKNKSIISDTWSKHRSLNNSTSHHIKTESSQIKAWNERNNANFYVCKDFSFTVSTIDHLYLQNICLGFQKELLLFCGLYLSTET